jgi:hypothetical protein
MGSPPSSLPLLGSLRSAQDRRGVREPLIPLSFDWGVPARRTGAAAGREEVWGQATEAKGFGERLREAARAAAAEMWAFARKDPRKPVFAAKVATALAFTTLLVFLREPRDIATHSIWAILTVVVVFEFSIGTFCFLKLPPDHIALCFFSQPRSHCHHRSSQLISRGSKSPWPRVDIKIMAVNLEQYD